MCDVQFHDHGSVWIAVPLTAAARDWMDEHIPEDAPWFGSGLAIEHRFVGDIAQGMADDGLQITQT